jgi:hypothetical protein
MPEIMKDLIEVETSYSHLYIIDESHTLADIVRFAVKQGSVIEVQFLLDEVAKTMDEAN